jgi:hypothetical protein
MTTTTTTTMTSMMKRFQKRARRVARRVTTSTTTSTGLEKEEAVARRRVLVIAAYVLTKQFSGTNSARAATEVPNDDDARGDRKQVFAFKSFTLTCPNYFKEVDVDYDKGRLKGASGLEILIRDSRFGLAGNTIQLSKRASPMNAGVPLFAKTEDLGDVDAVARKLVDGENQRSTSANAVLVEAKSVTIDGITYYDVYYTKKISFVDRIVRTRLCVSKEAVLNTLTVETDLERGTGDEAKELDDVIGSFRVL